MATESIIIEEENGVSADELTGMTVQDSAKEEPPLPQLNDETFASQLFWLSVTFIVLYLLISKSVLPKIHDVLEKRQHRIQQDLDRAEALASEAEEARKAYEAQQVEARNRSSQVLADAQHVNERNAQEEYASLDSKLNAKFLEAEKKLREQVTQVEKELTPIAQDVTTELVKILVGKKPTAAQVKKAVNRTGS
jgi:F-type H+-transporting ATPase subunit b